MASARHADLDKFDPYSRYHYFMDPGPDGTAVPLHGAIDGVRFTVDLPFFESFPKKVDLY